MCPRDRCRAKNNRTLQLNSTDEQLKERIRSISGPAILSDLLDSIICADSLTTLDLLPAGSVDLCFADPPYNLTKTFGATRFQQRAENRYEAWLEHWLSRLPRILKPHGSIYVCGDWRSSGTLAGCLSRYFTVRNRITWERDKGRGSKSNWKNGHEDIWFATMGDDYVFNLEAVKIHRRVRAPYTDAAGAPKDWQETPTGRVRLTHPSNLWNDCTVPFWSMPENTDHPTQKPEKLLAKIILSSSDPDQVVLDPFAGSGTTCVVARKLGRQFIGIEMERDYCWMALKRLELARSRPDIQGFQDGVFWERGARQS